MDDAITKAEEQVEKFTEMAKETKVLSNDSKKIYYFVLSLVSLLLHCSYTSRCNFFKEIVLPAGVRFLNQLELTCCFINQSGADCNLAPLRFPALGRGCTISRACRWLPRLA